MPPDLTITVLVDNHVTSRRLLAEHGWSVLVETASHRILFDTGQGIALPHNANSLDIDLSRIDTIALSHGHYDHTGGLVEAIAAAPDAHVFLHPHALQPKYHRSGSHVRPVGMPDTVRAACQSGNINLHTIDTTRELADGVFLTGPIPRTIEDDIPPAPFFLDEDAATPDPLLDDHALFCTTAEGLLVILGCAHAGVINTIQHIRGLTRNAPILAILGGMHLRHASEDHIHTTLDRLEPLNVRHIAPAHCTGLPATCAIRQRWPDRFAESHIGARFVFNR